MTGPSESMSNDLERAAQVCEEEAEHQWGPLRKHYLYMAQKIRALSPAQPEVAPAAPAGEPAGTMRPANKWPDDFECGMQHAYEIAACQPTLPAALSAISCEITMDAWHPYEHECPTCGKMREPLAEAHRQRDEAKRQEFLREVGEPADTLPELTYPVTHGCIHFRDVTPQGYVYHKLVRKEDYDALRQHAARLQAELAESREQLRMAVDGHELATRAHEAAERTVAERDKELAAARVNEARYLWLREYHWDDVWDWCIHNGNDDSPPCISPEATDAAIDAAREKGA